MAITHREQRSWGIAALLIGLASAYVVHGLWEGGFAGADPTERDRILVLVGVAGAVATAWFGHASYPRVHNFKIYALAVGAASVSVIAVLLVFGLPLVFDLIGTAVFPAAVFLGYASVLFVLLVTVVAPEYVGYRSTVRMTMIMVGIIAAAFAGGLLIPAVRVVLAEQLFVLRDLRSTVFWVFSSVAAAVLLLSLFTETHSFGLGGIHAGSVLLLSVGWLPPNADLLLQGMVLAWLPVVIAIGTLFHWFQRLENRASYDPLLRIYNRGWCDEVLAEQSRLDTRPPLGIGLIDLDHFKAINDTHGHDMGDAVLQEIAQRIRLQVVPRGSVARYGGEELIVFVSNAAEDELRALMEEVRATVESAPVKHRKTSVAVTCSIGCAVRTERDQPLTEVLKAADRAVYAAKDHGRNQVRLGRLRRKS
ncbi:MAG TPA: GGDEF domain-containing protein [Alkalispirochaeta sp.]|nr:GGDEF domain-containing protein [Alkalispirochaeta sp.]